MTVTVRVERHVLRRDPRRGVGARVRGPKWQVRRDTYVSVSERGAEGSRCTRAMAAIEK